MKTNTFLLLVIFTAHWLAWGAAPADRASYAYSLSLDGVDLDLVLPLAGLQFVLPEKDALYPGALAASAAPFQEVSLEAVPDELRPARSALMVGDARANLQDFRRDQQALALDGYTAELFGRPVESLSWRVELLTRVDQAEPVTLHEWLVEAGGRLWLLRIAYGADSPWAQVPLDGVHLDSSRVDVPSAAAALASALPPAPADAAPAAPAADDLPFPSWWDGECDVNNFPGSYPLGGSYRGMPACGPRNTQHLVYFGAGNSQYEWQCPELSKRYLYLAFGTPPYSANGNKVVANYPGDDFEKVNNGAPDKGPSAGDVLSYGATDAVGHTSVVSAASIDASGNGAITIIEQNWSVAGTRTHTVSNWTVSSPGMAVIGWLHLKDGSGGGGGAVVDTQAPAVIWAAPVGNDQLYTPPDATGPVTLQALASDDVGVASVRFSYWDAADALTVTLGSDASAPYQFSLDQRLLPYGDTRMIVEALDGSGKVSPAKQIRLRHSYQAACTACGLGDGFWPAYRGDLQHSGRSAERGPGKTGAAPAVLWQYSSGASSTAPAVGRDGTVYVGLGSSLYAFNLFGGLRWSYATNGTLRAPLTAADGTIYAGGSNGKLHAINPDGTRKWAFTTAGAVSGAPALGVDGAVLVTDGSGVLYSVDLNGSQKWNLDLDSLPGAAPAVDGSGVLYLGASDGLRAVNLSGAERWSALTAAAIDGSPAIGANGTLYTGSSDGKLYAFSPNGVFQWSYPTGGAKVTAPALSGSGTLYVGADDRRLYAISSSGALQWRYLAGGAISSPPAVDAQGVIYFAADDGWLYALNPDGGLRWKLELGGKPQNPVIGWSGVLFVNNNGSIIAVGTQKRLYLPVTFRP